MYRLDTGGTARGVKAEAGPHRNVGRQAEQEMTCPLPFAGEVTEAWISKRPGVGTVGYKVAHAAARLNENFMVRIEHSAAAGFYS